MGALPRLALQAWRPTQLVTVRAEKKELLRCRWRIGIWLGVRLLDVLKLVFQAGKFFEVRYEKCAFTLWALALFPCLVLRRRQSVAIRAHELNRHEFSRQEE
ncbi:MAG TPA: hypothetical protein DCY79_17555 [Planctomycetaceae bacterium]|nr:hypothetical protein [Blastopirellula sp.]HAY81612.1 hypothetical protein [Planctomycetaceae bacterium]